MVQPTSIDLPDILLSKTFTPVKRKVNDAEEPNFGTKRMTIDYAKMGLSQIISDADSGDITGLVSVGRGYFATGSSSGTIKIWEPLNPSQLAIITDEDGIDDMISISTKNDLKIVYVCKNVLKCFSVKNMRSTILYTSESEITALTWNQQQPTVISFGL